jgi:hypothetical protein
MADIFHDLLLQKFLECVRDQINLLYIPLAIMIAKNDALGSFGIAWRRFIVKEIHLYMSDVLASNFDSCYSGFLIPASYGQQPGPFWSDFGIHPQEKVNEKPHYHLPVLPTGEIRYYLEKNVAVPVIFH